jgi:hypothetical protein
MESFFLEKYNVAMGLVPVDLSAGANTGLRISMKNAKRITFLVTMGDSAAAVTDFTLQQHNAATAGTTKVVATTNPYFVKAAAATVWTKVVPGSAASNFVPTDFATEPGMIAFEVLAEDLDVNGDFAWVSLDIADTDATEAKLGAVIAIADSMNHPAYPLAL